MSHIAVTVEVFETFIRKNKMDVILKEFGDTRVKIVKDKYGLEFFTMRNGWQWSGFEVNDKLLRMMKEAIEDYLSKRWSIC